MVNKAVNGFDASVQPLSSGYLGDAIVIWLSEKCAPHCVRKNSGDSSPSVPLPRLRILEYSAARGAGTSEPDLPDFFETRSAGNAMRHADHIAPADPGAILPPDDRRPGLEYVQDRASDF